MPFNQLYITNKTEGFNFKSGCAIRVAKLTKEVILWFIIITNSNDIQPNTIIKSYINPLIAVGI